MQVQLYRIHFVVVLWLFDSLDTSVWMQCMVIRDVKHDRLQVQGKKHILLGMADAEFHSRPHHSF